MAHWKVSSPLILLSLCNTESLLFLSVSPRYGLWSLIHRTRHVFDALCSEIRSVAVLLFKSLLPPLVVTKEHLACCYEKSVRNILLSAGVCRSLRLIRGNIHGLVLKWLNIYFLIHCVGGAHCGLKFKFSSFLNLRKMSQSAVLLFTGVFNVHFLGMQINELAK